MAFIGTYKLTSQENFKEFMTELGIGMVKRNLALTVFPTMEISQDGDEWTVKTESSIKSVSFTFKFGEEFDELRQDDVMVKSLITQDGDQWNQVQKGDKEVTIVRQFTDQGVTATATVNDVTCVRFYERQ
ncbi:Fatty acid-binding protein [Halotydeus destructor]|nr:Fatty acid-binding protein [Halotydeus destructor]